MPRKGQAYPVDDGWRERVKRKLADLDWTQADLARELKCGRSTITALLKPTAEGGVQQSPLKLAVHEALGWSPPIPPSMEEDAGEVWELLKQMTPIDRVRWLERGHALIDEAKRKK